MEMHQRVAQDCPGDNVALNIKGLDKNDAPDFAPPGRLEHDAVEPDGEPISLPTHTASNPSSEKVLTVEMPHQRPDQACPDDNVALNIKDLDKHNMQETYAHARRSEHGIVKPGEDVVSLPTHTASNPPTQEIFTVEMPHQRLDQVCPDDNDAVNIKGQDKNKHPGDTRARWTSGSRCCEARRRCRLSANTHGLEPVHGESVDSGNASSTS